MGWGSGTVRMSEGVTWPAVELLMGVGSPAGLGVGLILSDKVEEGPPAGFALVEAGVVSLDKVAGLLWRGVLPDGTVVLAPVVAVVLTVSVLLSVEGRVALPPAVDASPLDPVEMVVVVESVIGVVVVVGVESGVVIGGEIGRAHV